MEDLLTSKCIQLCVQLHEVVNWMKLPQAVYKISCQQTLEYDHGDRDVLTQGQPKNRNSTASF